MRKIASAKCANPACTDYHCWHSISINADQYGDDVRLSDLEAKFACTRCGKRGAEADWKSIETCA